MNQAPICIIDDDEDVRGVMSFALEFEGMKTLPMKSAVEALTYLRQVSSESYPCFIIVDFIMADMDGITFIKKLRQEFPDTLGRIPVAISSGSTMYELKDLPEDVLVLSKPLDLNHLITVAKEFYRASPLASSL